MRSSSRPAHRHPSYSHRTPSRPPPRFAFLRALSAMFSTFNIIRASVYFSVFICSIICLAIAAHFQSVLSASDLTRFVPFAIFVSSATLAIILVLSAFSVRRNMNPVSTRIEIGCLGLMGTFWIALGAFLVSSDSETANVECFVSATDLTPIDGGFSTETYQAQYRVLEAFSIINALLLLAFLLLLFILALGYHRKGHKDIWYSPVNALDGSSDDSKKAGKLPAPVTARRTHSQSKPQYTQYTSAPKRQVSEKRTYERRPSQSRQPQPQTAYIPERRPSQSRQPQPQTAYIPERRAQRSRSRPTERYRPDYYARDASPRR